MHLDSSAHISRLLEVFIVLAYFNLNSFALGTHVTSRIRAAKFNQQAAQPVQLFYLFENH